MILKKLFEEYDLPIERIVLKEYKRLGITFKEATVLLAFFSIYKKRRTYSMLALSKRLDYQSNEIAEHVESLIQKGLIEMALEVKDGKEREVFTLDHAFQLLENMFIEEEKEDIIKQQKTDIAQTLAFFENGMGRPLMAFELETIRGWYEDKAYSHESILEAMKASESKLSVKFIERYLNQKHLKPIELDQDIDEALDQIFKKIR